MRKAEDCESFLGTYIANAIDWLYERVRKHLHTVRDKSPESLVIARQTAHATLDAYPHHSLPSWLGSNEDLVEVLMTQDPKELAACMATIKKKFPSVDTVVKYSDTASCDLIDPEQVELALAFTSMKVLIASLVSRNRLGQIIRKHIAHEARVRLYMEEYL